MHKSTILGLFLITMLFLAATISMSKQVSAMQVSASQTSAVPPVVVPPKLTDAQIVCEECIKYWLHFLNAAQTGTLLNALINAINEVNFGSANCIDDTTPTVSGATCLTTGSPNAEYNTAQLFDICKNLELALKSLVSPTVTPEVALKEIEDAVLEQTNTNIDRVVRGLFDCFKKALLPILFPTTCPQCFRNNLSPEQERAVETWLADTPSLTIEGYCNVIDPTEEQTVRNELAKPIDPIDPGAGGPGLPQDVIDAIIECLKEIGKLNPSIRSDQSSSMQQNDDKPTSISQEQMHEQQIVKLKQLLESVR